MAIIWRSQQPLSVRDVVGELKGQNLAYTTVMTVMSRLAEKDILRRRPVGKAYVYGAKLSEQAMLSRSARRTVRKLVNDFGEVALAHFVEELDRAKPETISRLRKLRAPSAR
jgi:predicted transcriptional regulator